MEPQISLQDLEEAVTETYSEFCKVLDVGDCRTLTASCRRQTRENKNLVKPEHLKML